MIPVDRLAVAPKTNLDAKMKRTPKSRVKSGRIPVLPSTDANRPKISAAQQAALHGGCLKQHTFLKRAVMYLPAHFSSATRQHT